MHVYSFWTALTQNLLCQTNTSVTSLGRFGDSSGVHALFLVFSSMKHRIFCILSGWSEGYEEEDISKSECATKVICQEGVIREIATLKLLVGSSELAVPLKRIVKLDCVFRGDFTMEEYHWWAGKGSNTGQLMRVGLDEDGISTSACIWRVCSNRITGVDSSLC